MGFAPLRSGVRLRDRCSRGNSAPRQRGAPVPSFGVRDTGTLAALSRGRAPGPPADASPSPSTTARSRPLRRCSMCSTESARGHLLSRVRAVERTPGSPGAGRARHILSRCRTFTSITRRWRPPPTCSAPAPVEYAPGAGNSFSPALRRSAPPRTRPAWARVSLRSTGRVGCDWEPVRRRIADLVVRDLTRERSCPHDSPRYAFRKARRRATARSRSSSRQAGRARAETWGP